MLRVAFALLIVIATAGLATIFPDIQTIVIVAGGVGAVFVAALATTRSTVARTFTAEPIPDSVEGVLIQAITEPMLLVVDGRVRIANAAARALLGTHVVGEDVRLAIRHPRRRRAAHPRPRRMARPNWSVWAGGTSASGCRSRRSHPDAA